MKIGKFFNNGASCSAEFMKFFILKLEDFLIFLLLPIVMNSFENIFIPSLPL